MGKVLPLIKQEKHKQKTQKEKYAEALWKQQFNAGIDSIAKIFERIPIEEFYHTYFVGTPALGLPIKTTKDENPKAD